MKNLIIIGNGFDKSHDLKTTYNEFIEDLLTNYFRDNKKYPNIFSHPPDKIKSYNDLQKYIVQHPNLDFTSLVVGTPNFKNKLIRTLLWDMAINNWCDIEYKYFVELMKCTEKDIKKPLYRNPINLNDDFEVIKQYLSEYLIEEEKQAKKLESYENLFKKFADSNNTLILNFNYTRTLNTLYGNVIKCPLMHIHGKLEDKTNPMIFGYAANNEQTRKLYEFNNNEYLKNIKKNLYKRTNNKNGLNKFLGENNGEIYKRYPERKIDIFIFGHSCGLSDNLILKEIFNHEAISSIKIFYYDTPENYFDTQVNIDRIMDDNVKFGKLETFPNSHRMPQWNDSETQIQEFIKYLENVKANYPKPPKSPQVSVVKF